MARTTKDLAAVIRSKLARDPALAAAVEDNRFSINVGAEIHRARMEAGFTQTQLASRAGTHQSVVARLEDADYAGHSLTMLKRIAKALGRRLVIEFQPATTQPSVGKTSNGARRAKVPPNVSGATSKRRPRKPLKK